MSRYLIGKLKEDGDNIVLIFDDNNDVNTIIGLFKSIKSGGGFDIEHTDIDFVVVNTFNTFSSFNIKVEDGDCELIEKVLGDIQ